MAATPNVKSPPCKHTYPLYPLLITMSAIFVAIRSCFLDAKPLFSDKILARSFRAGYPPALHAVHADYRPSRAYKRATLHREPHLLSSAQPICLRTLTGLFLRFGLQARPMQDTSAYYPGGLGFFDERTDPDGIKYSSRLDFLRAMLTLSYDSTFIMSTDPQSG